MKIDQDIFEHEDIYDIIDAIAEEIYTKYEEVNFDELDEVTQNSIVFIGLDGEIDNGGFLQFIENSSGDFYEETLRSAKAMGSQGLVDALEKVAKQFPKGTVPTDTIVRQDILEELKKENDKTVPFAELDHKTKAELLANHDNSYPIEECSFAVEETEWTLVWEDLDQWYYENHKEVYQAFINYLKAQA